MSLYDLPIAFWSHFIFVIYLMFQPKYVTYRPSQSSHSAPNIFEYAS